MKLTYESTIDDAVVAQVRLSERCNEGASRFKLVLPFTLLVVFLAIITNGSVAYAVFLGVVFACFYTIFLSFKWDRFLTWYIRIFLIRFRGSEAPCSVTVELAEEACVYSTKEAEMRFCWDALTDITVDEGGMELYFQGAGLVWLPVRVFETPAMQDEWLAFAKEKLGPHIRQKEE